MPEHSVMESAQVDTLFEAILKLENKEECREFFQDLCTVKELADMAQRIEAAQMLLAGRTYQKNNRMAKTQYKRNVDLCKLPFIVSFDKAKVVHNPYCMFS